MTTTTSPLLLREEKDLSKIIQWSEVSDNTAMLMLYYKQRLGPGLASVPSVSVLRRDWLTLLNPPNGNHIYIRMSLEDEEAAKEASFYYDPNDKRIVKFTFHIETPNPGQRFLAYLGPRAKTDFLKALLQNLLTLSRDFNDLHLQWQRSPVKYHKIAVPVR